MPQSLLVFIWQISGRRQILLCVLTLIVSLLTTLPLELQRRIVDDAIHDHAVDLLLMLSAAYLGVLLLQGGLKYWLNVYRGYMVEHVAREVRHLIFDGTQRKEGEHPVKEGAVVSMVAAEVEDLAGFVGDSVSFPLLQAGTALSAMGYLIWVEPRIALFAIMLYLPQLFVVPLGQRRINRWGNIHARLLRKMGDTIVGTGVGAGFDRHGRPKFRRRFMRLVTGAYRTRRAVYRVKFFLTFFGNLLDALAPLIVLSVGGWLVIRGEVEVSTLVVFITGFQKVADPWDQLLTFYRTASNANVKYRLIADALPRKPAMSSAAG